MAVRVVRAGAVYDCAVRRAGSWLAVVALTGVAACGGTNFDSARKADPAADLAVAKRSVLTAADMPGYTAAPHSADDDLTAAEKQTFAKCLGTSTTFFDDKPGEQKADSPDFSKGENDETSVSSDVAIETSQSLVDKDWKVLTDKKTPGCFLQVPKEDLKDSAPGGATVSNESVDSFDAGIGRRSLGLSITVDATAAGQTVPLYADVIFVGRDRAEIEVDSFNIATPFDRTTLTSLAQTVYDRVGNGAE